MSNISDWKYQLSLALPEDFSDELLCKILDVVEPALDEAQRQTWDKAITAGHSAFDQLPGDSQSYHDNTMVNAGAMERRVVAALEAARSAEEKQ